MNVGTHIPTIEMEPAVARVHYLKYQRQVRSHREARRVKLDEQGKKAGKELGKIRIEKTKLEKEDEELTKAYRALSQGQRLINLQKVMQEVGSNNRHLPILAICKADAEFCYFRADRFDAKVNFSSEQWRSRTRQNTIWVPRSAFKAEVWNTEWRKANNYDIYPVEAVVPAIPPHLRPDELSKFYIMWEAEWSRAAPADPILLSRVNETMFAVVAQWDLTPIEQQILEGRFGR